MKKWTFLCIPLFFVLLILTGNTYKPMSQAASFPLTNNSHDFYDAPHYNMSNINATHADTAKRKTSLLRWNPSFQNNEEQDLTNPPTSRETHSQINFKPPIVTQGLLPQANYQYTYAPSFEGEARKTYDASINPYLPNAIDLIDEDFQGYTYIESDENLELGIAYSDVFFFSLRYPMTQQTTTIDTDYGFESNLETEVMVESTSMTLTTKAGTFENVVVIRYPNGSTLYLAKGFGIIRITDFVGEITTELISRK